MRISTKYRDLPVKLKLHLIIIASIAVSLIISGCAVLTYFHSALRQAFENDLVVLADMYGANSTAALTFSDRAAAQELLSSFRAKRSIVCAAVYAKDRTVFARYDRQDGNAAPVPRCENAASNRPDRIRALRTISLDEQHIGSIYLESDLDEVNQSLKQASFVLLGILAGTFAIAFVLAAKLQTAISEPMRRLGEVARQVSTSRDYSTRALKLSNDDLGQLTVSFNDMLTEIERRDAQLLANQDRLEQSVVERTAELAEARDRAEQTCVLLDQSRLRLSLALEGSSEALWDCDLVQHRTYYSERLGAMLGYSPEEIGDSADIWERLIHPYDRAATVKAFQDHLDGLSDTYESEYRMLTKQGGVRWIQTRGRVVERAPEGTPTRIAGTHLDITERKEAEQALAHQHDLFNKLIESVPDHIYFKDRDSRFILTNQAMVHLFGLREPAELLGKSDFDFFTAEHAEQARADELDLIEGRVAIISKEEKETWPDGRESWVQSTKLPFHDESGFAIGTFGISRDITERKRMEEALRAAKDAAEAASRAKSEFLANMSHEIRTPMNGIIGMTELALETELTEEQRDYLKTVRSSGESLLSIINDILDFSKIEAAKLTLDRVEFDLDELLQETVRTVTLSAHQKGLELLYENEITACNMMVGDPGRMRQVIINLLGNAVKFTASGEVRLHVKQVSRDDFTTVVQFNVSDTGIGVSPEWRERIFEAFVQADSSNTRRFGGTGLGLAISSRLVALMEGRLWLDSETSSGSHFHFTANLGISTGAARQLIAPNPMVLQGLRVLVVDDNATNRRILKETLTAWLTKPFLADSGEQALELLRLHAAAGKHFDLVLLDAQMPGMDGFTLSKRICSDAILAGPRIIMLSSVDGGISRIELSELGIAQYVVKPVTRANLLRVILKVIAIQEPVSARQDHSGLGRSAHALHILLAEDNVINQKVAQLMLEKQGHSVTAVSDGAGAVDVFDRESVDLILMDVQMPVMNGYEATRVIREREQRRGGHIPIIALTAHAMKGDREICQEAGMDDYLSKPIGTKQLHEMLAKWAANCARECA